MLLGGLFRFKCVAQVETILEINDKYNDKRLQEIIQVFVDIIS